MKNHCLSEKGGLSQPAGYAYSKHQENNPFPISSPSAQRTKVLWCLGSGGITSALWTMIFLDCCFYCYYYCFLQNRWGREGDFPQLNLIVAKVKESSLEIITPYWYLLLTGNLFFPKF